MRIAQEPLNLSTGSRFKVRLREMFRKAEILLWYLCYKIVTALSKESPQSV